MLQKQAEVYRAENARLQVFHQGFSTFPIRLEYH